MPLIKPGNTIGAAARIDETSILAAAPIFMPLHANMNARIAETRKMTIRARWSFSKKKR